MKWPLARVVDGVAQVAVVKTASEVIKRAVNMLCLLPLDETQTSDFNKC